MIVPILLASAAASAGASSNKDGTWDASDIGLVTRLGLLGHSAAGFDGQAPLTERALANAVGALDRLQNPPSVSAPAPTPPTTTSPVTTAPAPPTPAPAPPPVQVLSTVPSGATIGGTVTWAITMPNESIQYVAFAIDGTQRDVESDDPFAFARSRGGLVTTSLADGVHQLAVAVHLAGGSDLRRSLERDSRERPRRGGEPAPVDARAGPDHARAAPRQPGVVDATREAATGDAGGGPAALPRRRARRQPVTIKQLDAALVDYLRLGPAAQEIQAMLAAAGLDPPPNTGTEAIARLLDLRIDHPEAEDDLELLPDQSATRAEAAYSLAQVLQLDPPAVQEAQAAADGFTLPALRRVAAAHPDDRRPLRRLPVRLGRHEPDRRGPLRRRGARRVRLLRLRLAGLQADAPTRRERPRRRRCAAARPT